MSTIKVANLQHPSSPTTNLVLKSDGNVSGAGLDLIVTQSFSAVSSVSVNNCFSSTYQNYRVLIDIDSSSALATTTIRMRAAGSDDSTSNYRTVGIYQDWATTMNGEAITAWQQWALGTNDGQLNYGIEVHDPQRAFRTTLFWSSAGSTRVGTAYIGRHDAATQFDGLSVLRTSGTITGSLSIYGYRKA